MACAALSLFATVLPGDVRDDIAGALRRTVVGPIIALQAQVERARNAFAGREAIVARLDSLTLRNFQLSQLADENERLRNLLGLSHQLRWGFVPVEALRGREYGDQHTVLLTAGSNAGVVPRSAVVSPDGLVGLVTSVDASTSLAILWTHPDFRVSAMSGDGSTFGIIKPHLGDEPERFLLELRGVAFRDTLASGAVVRSSGLGEVIPRGIAVGTVMGLLETGEGWSRTYLVRPAVKPQDVTSVMIVLPERGNTDEGVSHVWSSPAATDSAIRAVVRAADSLAAGVARVARDSAQRDSAARADTTARRVPPDTAPSQLSAPRLP